LGGIFRIWFYEKKEGGGRLVLSGPGLFCARAVFGGGGGWWVISGFLCEVDENCALLSYYAASIGNFLAN